MQTSQAGINLIKTYEGVRLKAYKPVPTEKSYTIGYGHYGVNKDAVITLQEAENLLRYDLKKFENYVMATGLQLNQNQFDALVSFTYNCGSGCLQTLVKNRTLPQIADAMLKYCKAGGKVLDGLVKRRKAERELFLKSSAVSMAEEAIKDGQKLPYKVKTICDLNIRTAAGTNYPLIRTAKKGEVLTVWAVCTSGGLQWGKNGKESFALKYCEVV